MKERGRISSWRNRERRAPVGRMAGWSDGQSASRTKRETKRGLMRDRVRVCMWVAVKVEH